MGVQLVLSHTHTDGRQLTCCVVPHRDPHAGAVNIYSKANREKKEKTVLSTSELRGCVDEFTLWETLSAHSRARETVRPDEVSLLWKSLLEE